MGKKKILIVDDEPNIRLLVATILVGTYDVIEAKDGQEAIDITCREKPDLIMMDIMMPNVDGYTACTAIKSNPETKVIPVIMLTGVGYDLNRKLAEKVGAEGYVTKPFTKQELVCIVDKFMPSG